MNIGQIKEVSKFNWPPENHALRETWRHVIDYKIMDSSGELRNILLGDDIDKGSQLYLIGRLLGCPSFAAPIVSPVAKIKINGRRKFSFDYGRCSLDSNRGLWILGSKCSQDSTSGQVWYKLETPAENYEKMHHEMLQKTNLMLMVKDARDQYVGPNKYKSSPEEFVKGHKREAELLIFISHDGQFIQQHLPALDEAASLHSIEADDIIIDENDTAKCAVCLSPESWTSDEIMFCEGPCESCVHMSCYGLQAVPEDEFYCDGCKIKVTQKETAAFIEDVSLDPVTVACNSAAKTSCCLCFQQKGMLKAVGRNRFAHIICLTFCADFRDVVVDSGEMVIGDIPADRRKLKCVYCKKLNGCCVQCFHGDCLTAFHPFCAQKADALLVLRNTPNPEIWPYDIYCSKHERYCAMDGVISMSRSPSRKGRSKREREREQPQKKEKKRALIRGAQGRVESSGSDDEWDRLERTLQSSNQTESIATDVGCNDDIGIIARPESANALLSGSPAASSISSAVDAPTTFTAADEPPPLQAQARRPDEEVDEEKEPPALTEVSWNLSVAMPSLLQSLAISEPFDSAGPQQSSIYKLSVSSPRDWAMRHTRAAPSQPPRPADSVFQSDSDSVDTGETVAAPVQTRDSSASETLAAFKPRVETVRGLEHARIESVGSYSLSQQQRCLNPSTSRVKIKSEQINVPQIHALGSEVVGSSSSSSRSISDRSIASSNSSSSPRAATATPSASTLSLLEPELAAAAAANKKRKSVRWLDVAGGALRSVHSYPAAVYEAQPPVPLSPLPEGMAFSPMSSP